ncbi:phage holin family protein [Bulleidia sp. zg-1006]|uniref:phage holin family protein n=1 Tax=Bulleidia sp. zg-1006 TaxID=2806552 RepID=UPI00193AD280|nr:phage holin family protein [Bulleidia sp. zg-1006]QRG86967.1 phage holin family protein [Bulleidia sp. zg-1006]
MSFFVHLAAKVFSLWLMEYLFHLVKFRSFGKLIVTAFVLMVLNSVLKPILHFLALPITILTIGLFALVINGIVVYVAFRLSEVQINDFSTAIIIGILLTIVDVIMAVK